MDNKHLTVILMLASSLVVVDARGPHHPRDKVVKRHVHYTPTKEHKEKLTEDAQLLHDKEHIQEHLEELIPEPDLTKMSDEELEFYYFQLHDTDKNSKLDGLEILQAILHTQDHQKSDDDDEDDEDDDDKSDEISNSFEYYVELIDEVLKEDDSDKDGYLSYPEYVSSRKEAHIKDMKYPTGKMIM